MPHPADPVQASAADDDMQPWDGARTAGALRRHRPQPGSGFQMPEHGSGARAARHEMAYNMAYDSSTADQVYYSIAGIRLTYMLGHGA